MASYILTPAYYLAISQTQNRYFTGKPCVNGHVAQRRVRDHRCVDCVRNWHNAHIGTPAQKAAKRRYDSSPKGRASQRRYRASQKRKESARRYYLSPKGRATQNKNNKTEKGRASRKRFFQTEKGKAGAIREQNKRRARKANQHCVPFSFADKVARFALFGDCCAYCRSAGPLAEDHFVPLKLNGGHFIGNIVPACKPCNSQKNDFSPEDWYKRQTFFDADRWQLILSLITATP